MSQKIDKFIERVNEEVPGLSADTLITIIKETKNSNQDSNDDVASEDEESELRRQVRKRLVKREPKKSPARNDDTKVCQYMFIKGPKANTQCKTKVKKKAVNTAVSTKSQVKVFKRLTSLKNNGLIIHISTNLWPHTSFVCHSTVYIHIVYTCRLHQAKTC